MKTHITRRRRAALASGLTLALGLAFLPALSASAAEPAPAPLPAQASVASAAKSPFAASLEAKYVDPDRVYSTDVRWWLGKAANTDESLLEEIQALYDGGFRGVELCMQSDAAAPDATYAYGSPMWEHKWNLMMNKMLDLGMSVYLTSGTNWATSNVPGLDPTSPQAMQNLTLGTGEVKAGETTTSLAAPAAASRKAGAKFVTAYAYRVTSGNTVDPKSFIDLKPQITQGADVWTQNLNWTAPSDGTYRTFGLWTQGTYQAASPSTEPSYATNYFDARGVEALKAFWEKHYLKDPALREKIAKGDVQLFMDSLEINTGTGFTWWADDMAAEFKKRKGYDITPHLFLISGVASDYFKPYHRVSDVGTYKLDGDEKRRQRIINDYQDVLTQLYRERMLQPLKKWLNSVGIETRAQISYGKPVEMSEPAMDVDYPETENFNQYNQVDIFRLWTGASKLENKVLSSETGAELGANGTRLTNLQDAYSSFAAGIQRQIWHIWGAGYGYGSFQWPGFQALGGFQYWGTKHPESANYDELNAHLGRVQQLVQTGEARSDVGFIRQSWVHGIAKPTQTPGSTGNDINKMEWQKAHQGIYYRSTELQDNGYTYDYFSPKFLFDDDVHFDTKTKTIEKAGYKAVVLYEDWLDLDASKRLLSWAKQGLKVVVLDNAASQTPFNDGKDAALKKVMTELKTLPTVRTATVYDDIDYFSATPGGYDDNVLEKLKELGVEPYVGYEKENQQLLSQTRQDAKGNRYVYLFNYDDGSYLKNSYKPAVRSMKPSTNIKTDIEVEGQFVPYSIDAWTGKTTQLAKYSWKDGKTIVPVDVDFNDISLLAFEKVDEAATHVISTDAASSFTTSDGVTVRSTKSGDVTTTLSDGTSHQDKVAVPAASDITGWNLKVQSWKANATAGDLTRTETVDGVTTTNRKTSTTKTAIDVTLDKLTTWDNIPEVGKQVSGTGRYESSFDWDASKASGAYLDLGDQIEGGMTVWINGKKVGGQISTNPTKVRKDVGGVGKATIDDGTGKQVPLTGKDLYTGGVGSVNARADVSEYLVDGKNSIVIEYNSALMNAQLDRGAVTVTPNFKGWWQYDIDYLSFGPKQAKLVPFVDVTYSDAPAPPVTPPVVAPPGKATPTVSFKLSSGSVKAGRNAKATIVVKAASDRTPTGTVTIKKGNKTLKTVKLRAGDKGKRTVTVPKLPKGKHTLKVVYSGGEDLRGKTSVNRSLTVK